MTPQYSVIITVRDRQQLLDRCLRSVHWQSFRDYEVVLVDYGSNPAVRAPDDSRIRIVRMEPPDDTWNGCVALNAGIANARASQVVLLNCDCLMAPDLLGTVDRMLSAADAPRQIYWRRFDLSRGGSAAIRGMFRLGGPANPRNCFRPSFVKFATQMCLGRWHPLTSYGDFLAVRKQPLIDLGGFDERMTGWGQMDLDMMERLKALGYAVHWGMELELIHQFHPPQANQNETVIRNIALSRDAIVEGQLVRNGGAAHLEKYVESTERREDALAECIV